MAAPISSPIPRDAHPPDHPSSTAVEGRAVLWQLLSPRCALRCELVAMADGVEVELYQSGELRRRLRFLTDAQARARAERLRRRLEGRGFDPLVLERSPAP